MVYQQPNYFYNLNKKLNFNYPSNDLKRKENNEKSVIDTTEELLNTQILAFNK